MRNCVSALPKFIQMARLQNLSVKKSCKTFCAIAKICIFADQNYMVVVAQLVRALDCGSRGRRFEPGLPPQRKVTGVVR